MADLKPLASLSAGLLARKGAARPAMRRQASLGGGGHFSSHDDLGWNDMGYDVDPHDAADMDMDMGGRVVNHGLSPLPGNDTLGADDDAMRSLDAAVDRAWDAPQARPVVEPMTPDAPFDADADIPPVRLQQKRLALELSAADHAEAAAARDALTFEPDSDDSPAAFEQMPIVLVARVAEQETEAEADPAPMPAIRPVLVVPAPAAIPAPRRAAAQPRSRAGSRGSFAFTLRLDPERHLKLRLVSAASNRSAQHILIALVDEFFTTQPDIDAFAAQLPASISRS